MALSKRAKKLLKHLKKSGRRLSRNWVDTTTAASALDCSPRHLKRLKEDGVLKSGDHWRDIRRPNSRKPAYRWHVKRIENLLDVEPGKRR